MKVWLAMGKVHRMPACHVYMYSSISKNKDIYLLYNISQTRPYLESTGWTLACAFWPADHRNLSPHSPHQTWTCIQLGFFLCNDARVKLHLPTVYESTTPYPASVYMISALFMCAAQTKPASGSGLQQLRTPMGAALLCFRSYAMQCTVRVGPYLLLHVLSTKWLHAQLSRSCQYMHCIGLAPRSSNATVYMYLHAARWC